MDKIFSEKGYEDMLAKLFVRFPSFQKTEHLHISRASGTWSSSTSLPVILTDSTG